MHVRLRAEEVTHRQERKGSRSFGPSIHKKARSFRRATGYVWLCRILDWRGDGHCTLFPSCGLLALRSRTRFFRPPYCLQIASGKGVLGQLALETGLPQSVIEIGLVAGIGYNLISVSLMV